ncbi:hypothetical protein Tco_0310040, partial [Tanacetum coccineum]
MMQNAGLMSLGELIAWEKEEASSPLLRTPPLKNRRKGIEFPYVRGPSTYVDETVVCDGHSLPDIEKECFANSVPLDSVSANLQVVLKKKKGRSMVK